MRRNLMSCNARVFLLSTIIVLCAGSSQAQGTAEKLYKTKCVACHAPNGSGDTPAGKKVGARDLRSTEVQSQSDAQLVELVTKGKDKMPAYGKTLKDDEIKDLVAYVRALAKKG
jgi:cytochrome c6